MSPQSGSPRCFLRWSVNKVADSLYVVAATVDGKEYDFVGNFKNIRDAQRAGRRYVQDHIHSIMLRARLSLE